MDALNNLIDELKKFPGVGVKSARRIAFHLLKKEPEDLKILGEIISGLKNNMQKCEQCGNISEKNPCSICSNPLRDRKTICVVEDIEALSAFEQAGIYNGIYHVLGEKVSPFEGENLSDESIDFLIKHIKKSNAEEIIIATNPKMEGDLTYYTLLEVLKNSRTKLKLKKISRLAFGLPVGGSIEFADRMTLHTALEARTQVIL